MLLRAITLFCRQRERYIMVAPYAPRHCCRQRTLTLMLSYARRINDIAAIADCSRHYGYGYAVTR